MNEPTHRLQEVLEVALGEQSTMIPFATAVMRHLSGSNGARAEAVVAHLLQLLAPFREAGESPPVDLLVDNPEMLASFLQNADLLDPEAPECAGIAAMVMAAIEKLGGDTE